MKLTKAELRKMIAETLKEQVNFRRDSEDPWESREKLVKGLTLLARDIEDNLGISEGRMMNDPEHRHVYLKKFEDLFQKYQELRGAYEALLSTWR